MTKNIVKFVASYESTKDGRPVFNPGALWIGSEISDIEEGIGPGSNEKCACFSVNRNTIPHIDLFNTITDTYDTLPEGIYDHGDIILRGSTLEYTIKKYADDDLTSLKQYFLENPTRSEIQYLIWDSGADSAGRFTAFIPGLLYSSVSGNPLGYVNSYIADENNSIVVKLPYLEDYQSYELQVAAGTATVSKNNDQITISNIFDGSVELELTCGSDSVLFNVYPNNLTGVDTSYIVKTVNEFGDYSVASRKAVNINDIIDILSEMEYKSVTIPGNPPITINKYFPKTYPSLILYSTSESVMNMTPNIYKVTAALVPNDGSRAFMIDVVGISANKILSGGDIE